MFEVTASILHDLTHNYETLGLKRDQMWDATGQALWDQDQGCIFWLGDCFEDGGVA